MTSLDRGGTLLALGLATGVATSIGGLGALRVRSAMGLLLGFGAGAVSGVAVFDLLPEALAIAHGAPPTWGVAAATACGFASYFAFDRLALRLGPSGGERGHLRAALLAGHSLADGLGIGLAFAVSTTAGAIVALGVLTHDLLDGANTVTLSLSGGASERAARRWLAADALAPALGMALSSRLHVASPVLAIGLAIFAGLFLNIGVCELLPQSVARRPEPSTAFAALGGLGIIYAAVRLAG